MPNEDKTTTSQSTITEHISVIIDRDWYNRRIFSQIASILEKINSSFAGDIYTETQKEIDKLKEMIEK
jgi:ABC-type oligopeptide transport system substrate-binding subunit